MSWTVEVLTARARELLRAGYPNCAPAISISRSSDARGRDVAERALSAIGRPSCREYPSRDLRLLTPALPPPANDIVPGGPVLARTNSE